MMFHPFSDPKSTFLAKHRPTLIQHAKATMAIADKLLARHIIHGELYSQIQAAATPQDQMRLLYETLSSGAAVRSAFYDILLEEEPHLMADLGKLFSKHPKYISVCIFIVSLSLLSNK